MRFLSILSLAALAPLASAILFTSPAENSTITKGSNVDLTWSTVDTDPTTFSILLVNFVDFPPSFVFLAENVASNAGAATVRVPCSTPSSFGFQFNAINGTNVFVIYAQTPKLFVAGPDCVDPPPATSSCPALATSTATATVYVTTCPKPTHSTHSHPHSTKPCKSKTTQTI
jgi:hypothetical protein